MKKSSGESGRRSFLKTLGIATAAISIHSFPTAALATSNKPKKRYGMLIDTRRCVGCHACSVACRSENNVPLGHHRSWVEYTERGQYPNTVINFLPRLCNQCSTPQCVSVCPANATSINEDGIVVIDPDVCIGCKYCIQACPYDARFINPETGAADKCDFCVDRVSQGLQPACVETCFQNARIFGDLNDPKSEISKLIATTPTTVLRQEMGTQPNVYYIDADLSDEHDARYTGQYIEVTTHRDDNKRR